MRIGRRSVLRQRQLAEQQRLLRIYAETHAEVVELRRARRRARRAA